MRSRDAASIPIGRDAFLDELFVIEACRRMGVGAATMEFIEERAKALGLGAVHLEVANQNHPAYSLYLRMGYQEHPARFMSKRLARGGNRGAC